MNREQQKAMFAKNSYLKTGIIKNPSKDYLEWLKKQNLPEKPKSVYEKEHENERRCDIVRFRFNGNSSVVKRNVPESVARLHCSDPKTRKEGVWFDGFRYRN